MILGIIVSIMMLYLMYVTIRLAKPWISDMFSGSYVNGYFAILLTSLFCALMLGVIVYIWTGINYIHFVV